nr:GDSL esterase/lipase [Ipomoea batatas]GMD97595.1 GDSL esterase/lipase [Ipomoea batatas]
MKATISFGCQALSKINEKATAKATNIPTIETKSVASPTNNFNGNETRKSSCRKREMRMDKNMMMEMIEQIIATASEIMKTVKLLRFMKIGVPVSPLPPGTVKAAAKTMVAIKVATSMQEVAVLRAAPDTLSNDFGIISFSTW